LSFNKHNSLNESKLLKQSIGHAERRVLSENTFSTLYSKRLCVPAINYLPEHLNRVLNNNVNDNDKGCNANDEDRQKFWLRGQQKRHINPSNLDIMNSRMEQDLKMFVQ